MSLRRRQRNSSSKKPSGHLSKKSPGFVTRNRLIPAVPFFQKVGNGLIFRINPLKSSGNYPSKTSGMRPNIRRIICSLRVSTIGALDSLRMIESVRARLTDKSPTSTGETGHDYIRSARMSIVIHPGSHERHSRSTAFFSSSHPGVRRKACARNDRLAIVSSKAPRLEVPFRIVELGNCETINGTAKRPSRRLSRPGRDASGSAESTSCRRPPPKP